MTGEGWVNGQKAPFTFQTSVFIGISEQKVKGEGCFLALDAIQSNRIEKLSHWVRQKEKA